jgi:gliding motility-associated-like protein
MNTIYTLKSLVLSVSIALLPWTLFAEGTRQLTPTSSDHGYIQIFDGGASRPFATFNCPEEHRLNFNICNLGEKVYFGFNQSNKDVYFRIKDPNGNLVNINGNTINQVPTSGAGFIGTYNQAYNGPSAIVGTTGGYNALSFTPTMTGDYYIEFNPKKNNQAATVIYPEKRVFNYFDITVATADNKAIPGRLWSKAWDLQCNGSNNPFNGKMYIYADDGIVTSIDFNGMKPYGFVVFANSSGLRNTGNSNSDRQSENGNINYPQYKIFLNDPDINCYPTGTFGSLIQKSTVSGCSQTSYCINVYTDQAGTIEVMLDLEAPAGFQPNSRDRIISVKDAVIGHNCVPWDGKDGKGQLVTSGSSIDMEVNFLNGLTHLPLFDVEYNEKGYIVELQRPTGPAPIMYWDDSKVGGEVNLTGCPSTSGCHRWPKVGNGFGNERTINTWWHAQTVKDNIIFTSYDIVVDANAGNGANNGIPNDTTICSSASVYQLNGLVVNATGGVWSSDGTGTFSDNTDIKGTYTLSANDINKGIVILTLTTTGTGLCPPQSDNLIIRIDKKPIITTSDVSVCANNAVTQLNSTLTNTTVRTWSGGAGSFNNTGIASPRYTPTAVEIASGSVTLSVTTASNGVCTPDTAKAVVTYTPSPVITTTSPLSVCKNTSIVNLEAEVTVANGLEWSGGNGSFSTPTSLNTTYTPTNAELNAGSVILTVTTTGNGNCIQVVEKVTVSFTNPPLVDAGSDQSICKNNILTSLDGKVSGSANHTWSGGSGTFSDNSSLTSTYTPSTADLNLGSVILYLTSVEGNCAPVKDSLKLTFTPAPTIIAADVSVCGNNPEASLSATLTGATQAIWEGIGEFSNPNSTNTFYTPDPFEISIGITSVYVTTLDTGNCRAAKDTVNIYISSSPTANAGTDQSICKNNPNVTLAGTTGNGASGRQWIGGSGVFAPDRNSPNAIYIPTSNEIQSGSIKLVLSASKTSCLNVTDTMSITFTDIPTANAGPNTSICFNNPEVTLNGSVSGATGGIWSGGSGTFDPNNTDLNALYTPTSAELEAGSFELILTTSGNGNCNAISDTVNITVTPSPTATAGSDFSVCSNNADIQLNGSFTLATAGVWSGGSGLFVSSNTQLDAIYKPTEAEINSGSVTLTLTSTAQGNCSPVDSKIKVSFTPAPTITPNPVTICADNAVANLDGSVTVATGGTWSGGNGTFNNISGLKATYTPTPTEIAAGTVELTFTSTNNSNCKPVSSNLDVTINQIPQIDAGADQTLCGNITAVDLKASIERATGVAWSVIKGNGTITNATSLSATYNPTNQDRLDGVVTIKATSTGNGFCKAVEDSLKITFTVVPSVNAGNNQTVCTNDLPVQLDGSGSTAIWSGGSGTFLPNANDPKATYTPAASEYGSSVTLTLTTIPSGACPTVSDQVVITIPNGPVANAGADIQICGNDATLNLNGTVSNATGGNWTHNGSGTIDNIASLNTVYNITNADRAKGSIQFVLSTTGNVDCSLDTDTMLVTLTPSIKVNAGSDQTICSDAGTIQLAGTMENAEGIIWTSNGSGTFSDDTALDAVYTLSTTDRSASTISFTLTTTGNGICPAKVSSVEYTLTPAPTVNAGNDITICGDSSYVNLAGTYTIAGGVSWSTTGTGSFSPVNSTEATSYYPSADDKAAGLVSLVLTTTDNGTCNPVRDTLKLTINNTPIVTVGIDTTLCADAGIINLNGEVANAGGGIWTSSGTGVFDNNTNLDAIYTFSSQDSLNSIVTLTLTSTANGLCKAVSAKRVINLSPAPTLTVGADQTICADASLVSLSANITVATGINWTTSGTGNFDNPIALTSDYYVSSEDTAAKTIYLIATTTGNGKCKPVVDSVELTILPKPIVFAGADITICADSAQVAINGTVLHAGGGVWTSSGTGSFLPATSLVSSYMPSLADRAFGSISLILTSTENETCIPVKDTLTLTITPAPTVNAGFPVTVCADTAFVQLNGAITVSTTAGWISSGSGIFLPDSSALNAQYIPSEDDILAEKALLTLITTDNGQCTPKNETVEITINPIPIVSAGADRTLCADVTSIPLNGNVKVAGGGVWSSSGTGYFMPTDTDLNASYIPSSADTSNGSVQIYLTSTQNDLCKPVIDTMTITFTPQPIVIAGSDETICADYTGLPLHGSVLHATASIWTTSGTGYFSPSATQPNATYVPSEADTTNRSVQLALTTTSMGTCNAVSDTINISILPSPSVSAGDDITICSDAERIHFDNASVTNAGSGIWTTSGDGYFSPSANMVNAVYIPSDNDLTNKSVVLTLTTDQDSVCTSVSDVVVVNFDPIPEVNAGKDLTVCKDTDFITINGSVKNASGGAWATFGEGTFADFESLQTTYTPSSSDTLNGSVTLRLTSTGNGSCNFASEDIVITFSEIPTVAVNNDLTICSNANDVNITGIITTASGGTWTTSGDGSFSPSINTLLAKYIPGPNDKTNGNVNLTLTSTGNGTCKAYSEQMEITIQPEAIVHAGLNQTVCADTAGVVLDGSILNATSASWSTASGTGTFLPNSSDLNATFIPSDAQIASGKAIITLTSDIIGACASRNDVVEITINKAPTLNVGTDLEVCAGLADIDLNSNFTVSSGVIWSGGVGSFTSPTTSATVYNPTASEHTAGNTISLYVSTTGNGLCKTLIDTVNITFSSLPPIKAGADRAVCDSDLPLSLNGSGSPGNWIGGIGTFSPSRNSLIATYQPDASEITTGSVKLYLETINDGLCAPGRDSITINFEQGPILNAGLPQVICGNENNIQLNGNANFTPGILWKAEGTGTFVDNTVNNPVYNFTNSDVTSGQILFTLTSPAFGNCKTINDTVRITFSPSPTINAGQDKGLCANIPTITLSGNYTVATAGSWSVVGGSTGGSFDNATLSNPVYTPSPTDIANKQVSLKFETTSQGTCLAVSDTVKIFFTDAPTVLAGSPDRICADSTYLGLNGSVTVAAGGAWSSSGTGSFSPNAYVLDATYLPSEADLALSSVTLRLTTTGNGDCLAEFDEMDITIDPIPTVDGGGNSISCKDIENVSLNGSYTIAGGIQWSTSGTGTFNSDVLTNASYTPSQVDKDKGSVMLTIVTTNNDLCKPVIDKKRIDFTPIPEVDAGYPQTICANAGAVALNAKVKVASGVAWTSPGNQSGFSNDAALATNYTPNATELSAGSVLLTAISTGNGTCLPVSDTVRVFFSEAPTLTASPAINVCADIDSIKLNSVHTIASGVLWSTSGNGFFIPSAASNNPSYIPSALDTANLSVALGVITTGNGDCIAINESVDITMRPAPVVSAGADTEFCYDAGNVQLNGSSQNSAGIIWSTTSGGNISDPLINNPIYTFAAREKANGTVLVKITTTGNADCKVYSDAVVLTKRPFKDIKVLAGVNFSLCSDATTVNLNGYSMNSGTSWSTSNSFGTFAAPANLSTAYTIAPQDITNGSVTFVLSSTDHGICNAVEDSITMTLTPIPTVFAGNDTSMCGDVEFIALNGTVTTAKGGIWSTSGNGQFSPSATNLNAIYTPTRQDVANGKVFITLTSTNNGTCKAYKTVKEVVLTTPPTVDAGSDISICADNEKVYLNGEFTIAGFAQWASSGTGSFSDEFDPKAFYIPSAQDTVDKAISITFTTHSNGKCNAVNDNAKITFTPKPEINAGLDALYCANSNSIPLKGIVKISQGANWTTSGNGSFTPSVSALNASYKPSIADITNGTVLLTITSTGNGTCSPVTDTVRYNFAPVPIVDAGMVTNCIFEEGTNLAGTISNATGGAWSSTGNGQFSPSIFDLNATYIPSNQDFNAGNVTIMLTSTGNGVCNAVVDVLNFVVSDVPDADAGPTKFVCLNEEVGITAKALPGYSYIWSNTNGQTISSVISMSSMISKDTSFIVTATDPNGCYTNDTVQVKVVIKPTLNLDPHYCFVSGMVLDAAPQNLPQYPGQYTWFKEGSVWTGRKDVKTSIFDPGNYEVSYTVGNCVTRDVTSVTAPPSLITPYKLVCENEVTSIGTTASSDLMYNWTRNGQYLGGTAEILISALPDTNKYHVLVTDLLGCTTLDSTYIIGIPKPNALLSDTTLCEGGEVILNGLPKNLNNPENYTIFYNWSYANKNISKSESITANNTGYYTLKVNIDYCQSVDSARIRFNPGIEPFLQDAIVYCENDSVLTLDASPAGLYGMSYMWSTGETSKSIEIDEPGAYAVTVTNGFNCTFTDSVLVTSNCGPNVYIPNAIYPGNDAQSGDQFFTIFGKYFENFEITIFNRWGEIIFYSTDPKSGWDGTYLGELMPGGVYPYIVRYKGTNDGKKYQKDGLITIVR